MRRRLPWVLLAAVVVVALAVGSRSTGEATMEDRVRSIASTIKCPECPGQSSAASEGIAARAIRTDIEARLKDGQSADEIRDYYASRFTEEVLLTPSRTGTGGLVWAIPVVALVAAFGGLGLAFRRWQATEPQATSDEDRDLVAAALATDDPHGEGSGQ